MTGIIDGTGSVGASIGQLLLPVVQHAFGWVAVFYGFILMVRFQAHFHFFFFFLDIAKCRCVQFTVALLRLILLSRRSTAASLRCTKRTLHPTIRPTLTFFYYLNITTFCPRPSSSPLADTVSYQALGFNFIFCDF